MEHLFDIAGLFVIAQEGGGGGGEEGGSFLVSPSLGLMIWTLALFAFTLWVLSKVAFPRIQEALDKRANAIRESIEAAARQREEADELLAEYRQRLTEAREQADDIVAKGTRGARSSSPRRARTSRSRRDARWSGSARRSPT